MPNRNMTSAWWVMAVLWTGSVAAAPSAASAPDTPEDASAFVSFVQDFAGTCVSRNGVQILVKNTHPTRTIKVWLDRYHMGTGTGDRSRSELRPAAEPEPLGCSRTTDGSQEWRLVRAIFSD